MPAAVLLAIPAVGALVSLVSGIVAYLSWTMRRQQGKMAVWSRTGRITVNLDPENLRLTDAEHPDRFIEVTPDELGQIAEQFGHRGPPDDNKHDFPDASVA
jgi:hypothetical protein